MFMGGRLDLLDNIVIVDIQLITYLFLPSQSEYPLVQGCWWWTWPGGERLTSAPCSIARGTPTNGALQGLSLLILLKLPLPSPVRWSHKCHLDCQKLLQLPTFWPNDHPAIISVRQAGKIYTSRLWPLFLLTSKPVHFSSNLSAQDCRRS